MPTQVEGGFSRCFCGAEITMKSIERHIADAHAGIGAS